MCSYLIPAVSRSVSSQDSKVSNDCCEIDNYFHSEVWRSA